MEDPFLSGLDAALHELGMLSSITESRREYLKEQQPHQCNVNRQALNVLHMNTRFVTKVNMGCCKREFRRFRPFSARDLRRVRTKSMNSDVDIDIDWLCETKLTPVVPSTSDNSGLYKSRSLEDIQASVSNETDVNPVSEVESVSDQIQQLQVCE